MKVALVHDYIKEYGGAERVLEALHGMFPDAPVYTLVYAPQFLGPHQERFASWDIHQSWLGRLPFAYKFLSIFRLIAPMVFRAFDFSGFDVIIVSATGAYNPNIIKKGNAKQICYCHTPPRYLYGYATARQWKKNIVFRILGEIANHILRIVDYTSSRHVDVFIANSHNVAARIKKFYRRDSVVIYPPIELHSFALSEKKHKRGYYLAGGRLARPKHIDLIIQAANSLKLPVKIFGKGFAGYGDELQQMSKESVEFVGEVSDSQKEILMREAKAFIIASEDEDFGMTPVEAMGVGTPVIAYRSGGLIESVIDGKTGIFFNELTRDSLADAIERFQKLIIDPKICRKRAEDFSKRRFEGKIEKIIAG